MDIYVPNKLEVNGEEYTVLKLADSIFENNDAINSVTLASGILEIGAKAFYDCDNLVCILVSEELTTIGAEAF
ncbi:MAG: leucine-rich repeat protein [Clostridia bacterium]|nr:leucine-rich repeat protein [Clostridia bacterium]